MRRENSHETIPNLILSRREAPSRRMDARHGLAAILRDARKGALLRMRFEIVARTLSRAMISH
jgi:hypothetical protein